MKQSKNRKRRSSQEIRAEKLQKAYEERIKGKRAIRVPHPTVPKCWIIQYIEE